MHTSGYEASQSDLGIGVAVGGGGGAAVGGGGTTINIRQTVIAGEFATKRDVAIVADQTKRAAIDGAQAALINRKKRGGLDDVFG